MSDDFRARLRTADERGRRIWVYADIVDGFWRKKRKAVAFLLIAFYLALPWLKINKLPLIQIDLQKFQIHFFGTTFFPHELGIFIPLVLGTVISIFALTAIVGRIWCGWACPQTVFMEFIFRPLEKLIEGRPREGVKPDFFNKSLKWFLFACFSFIVANTFLALFIGSDELLHVITQSPAEHPKMFTLVMVLFAAFLFNFGWFREQMCTIVCPYGRLQSVLLDRQSLIVGYDYKRGEPRGKGQGGDCVNCFRCVQVCPTGIDIRDGVQLECINCTACIDACNIVMEKINKPKNLIGYTTERKLAGEPRRPVGARLYVYTIIIFCLTSIGAWGLYNRSSFDIELMRAGAAKFTKVDGKIQNHLQFRIENKTFAPMNLFIKSPNGSLTLIVPQNGAEISPSHELQIEVITQTMPELFSQGIAHQQILFENNLGENKTMNITLFGPER